MLSVTEAALKRLVSKLVSKKAADDQSIRISRRKGGWKLRLDRARPDDTSFQFEGRNVLLLDAGAAKAAEAMTLDVNDTESGPRLKIRRNKRRKP